jgi:putative colanic acid biosynthesis acetyltransferase WcaF
MKIHQQTFTDLVLRQIWNVVWFLFCRFTPAPLHIWRILILKLFGAKIKFNVHIYSSCKIFKPWNLIMDNNSCLGPNVDCYSYDKIFIGEKSIISQNTFLCAASHDYNSKNFELITAPIIIENNVWVSANAFVGPGVTIKNNSVILACAVVTKNTDENHVYVGNPARIIKKRLLNL